MKVYDPIHDFIRFDEIEGLLIDSVPFQRLRHIRQLGLTFLVYPGATHTRFEHSLGVMHVASLIFDKLGFDDPYWRRIVRLSALCHDLGHLPFSHAAEKALLGSAGHEKWTIDIVQSPFLSPIFEKLSLEFAGRDIVSDIIKISIGEKKLNEIGLHLPMTEFEKTVAEIIAGDFFGADRIDYLIRDARCTGVSHGLFDYHQLIESIVLSEGKIGIEESGIDSCEALLIARRFMHRRVYLHPTVQSYSAALCEFMQAFFPVVGKGLEDYLMLTDSEVLTELRKAWRDSSHAGHEAASAIFDRTRNKQRETDPTFKSFELLLERSLGHLGPS